MAHGSHTKMAFQCILDKFQNDKKIFVSNLFYHFLFAVSLGNWAPKMSEKFRLDRKIGFQNRFYTKCTNVIIDSIGPSIILRSIVSIPSLLFILTRVPTHKKYRLRGRCTINRSHSTPCKRQNSSICKLFQDIAWTFFCL